MFSTYVEVILIAVNYDDFTLSVLHVCGGDPTMFYKHNRIFKCSPRMWR